MMALCPSCSRMVAVYHGVYLEHFSDKATDIGGRCVASFTACSVDSIL